MVPHPSDDVATPLPAIQGDARPGLSNPAPRRFGLYLHIPFCLHKCAYCDFYSFADAIGSSTDGKARRSLVALLEKEWHLQLATGRWEGARLISVFFGGGTPSLLDPVDIGRLLEMVRRRFDLTGAEITLEANPETVDEPKLRRFREVGINRLSFGVQSFTPWILQRLERRHDAERPIQVFAWARLAGFDNLSLDLIFGHAGQTLDGWIGDLRRALDLQPEHWSAYALTLEPGSMWARRNVTEGSVLAPSDRQAEMLEAAYRLGAEAGYGSYEIGNHARPGRECRHNGLYWRRESYLGLGPSAHSFVRTEGHGVRWSNAASMANYAAQLEASAPWRETALSQEEAWEEEWLCRLRLAEGVPEASLEPYPEPWRQQIALRLEAMASGPHPMVERREWGWRLTPKGRLLGDAILARLLS